MTESTVGKTYASYCENKLFKINKDAKENSQILSKMSTKLNSERQTCF